MALEGVADLVRSRFPGCECRSTCLDLFFTGEMWDTFANETSEVVVHDGSVHISRARGDFGAVSGPYQHYVSETRIQGVPLSHRGQTSSFFLYGIAPLRITRRGGIENAPRSHGLVIPSGWTMLQALIREAGYVCTLSDKAQIALSQYELLGGIDNIAVLASSRLYELLRSLSEIREDNPRPFRAERHEFQYSEIKKNLGLDGHTSVLALEWLIAHGVLSRGLTLKCPSCGLKRWYHLDVIQELWLCEGCRKRSHIPLSPDVAQWKYELTRRLRMDLIREHFFT